MEEGNEFTYYIASAKELREGKRFPEARDALKQAYMFASNPDEIERADGEKRELDKACSQRFSELEKILQSLLKKEPLHLTDDDVRKGDETFAELSELETAETVLRVKALHEQWSALKRRREVKQLAERTKAEFAEHWKKPFLLLPIYDGAYQKALQLASEYPEEPAFQELLAEALKRREEAYKEEGVLTTAAEGGQYDRLDQEFQKLSEKAEKEGPWYEWVLEDGKRRLKQKRLEPFNLARKHFHELARLSQEQKADEYLQQAESLLRESPDTAATWVQKALELKYIGADKKREIEEYDKNTVQPAIAQRSRAKGLLQEARAKQRQPEEAWNLVGEAIASDPHLPPHDVESTRAEILPYLKRHLEKSLRSAKEAWQSGGFETAKEAASRVREVAEESPALHSLYQQAEQLIADCIQEENELAYVRQEAQRIESLASQNLQAAENALAALEQRVANKPERFQALLKPAQDKVRALEDLSSLALRLEQQFDNMDPAMVSDWQDYQAIRRIKEQLQRLAGACHTESIRRGKPEQLEALHRRILSRLEFYKGREAWQAELYQRAIEHLRRVAEDDQPLAQRLLEQAGDVTGAQGALEWAQQIMQQAPPQYEHALQVLEPWREKPSPLQAKVERLYREVETQWETALTTRLDQLLQDQENPLLREIERLIRILDERLHSPRAPEYKAKYLPSIYAQLAQGSTNFERKLEYLDKALEHAVGEERQKLLWEQRKSKKKWAFHQAEEAVRQGDFAKARQVLVELVSEYFDDVEALTRLVEVCLLTDETRLAESYLRQGQRTVEKAKRDQQPTQAGLESMEELLELDFRLEALEEKVRAAAEIRTALDRAREALQPQRHIAEYRQARDQRATLQDNLKRRATQLYERIRQDQDLLACSEKIQAGVKKYWDEQLCQWLFAQAESLERTLENLEKELINALQTELEKIPVPDLAQLDFHVQALPAEVMRRWEMGMKLLYLFPPLKQGYTTLREVQSTLNRLRVDVNRLVGDTTGLVVDEAGNLLPPFAALEKQISWMENALDWLASVRDLLSDYNRAAGRSDAAEVSEVTGVYETGKQFLENLYQLRNCITAARRALHAAITAGSGPNHWGQVNWREVVHCLLLSPHTPLPPTAERAKELAGAANEEEKRRIYWGDLESPEMETRWRRWQEAAQVLQQVSFSEHAAQAPWDGINTCIRNAGIEEKWETIKTPLADIRPPYSEHRAVTDVLTEMNEWLNRRNRLVLLVAEWYGLFRAEEFGNVLKKMKQIEDEDRNDEFGFRQHLAIADPMTGAMLGWNKLNDELKKRQEQQKTLESWWATVRSSALEPWKTNKRGEVIELVKNGAFDAAYALAWDALYGALGNGRTNALGGGLALQPLKEYLQQCPVQAGKALSQQVSQRLKEVEQRLHDTEEAIRDLEFWLTEADQMATPLVPREPFSRPLKVLQREYEAYRDELEMNLDILRAMPTRFPWQKRKKDQLRQHCLNLLRECSQEIYAPALEKYWNQILEA